jgi:hypothetical protein
MVPGGDLYTLLLSGRISKTGSSVSVFNSINKEQR